MAPSLKRTLDLDILLLLGINAIIGTGIFFIPGIAAKVAGPASIISWILVAVLALLISFCFAELISMFPKSGGIYEYSKNAFGSFTGYVVGWVGWVVANIIIAMLIIGSLEYLSALIPLSSIQKILFSLIFIFFVNYISYKKRDTGIRLLLFFSVIIILLIWVILSSGIYHLDVRNFQPFLPLGTFSIVVAMTFILQLFFGWESITYLAEEAKNPKKNLPKVMIFSTIFIIALTLGIVAVSLGIIPWEQFGESASPLALVASSFLGTSGRILITIGIFITVLGTAVSWIITTPRLIFALSRDKLLPSKLSKVHPKYRTPHNAIFLQAILSSFIVISGSYSYLLKVVVPLSIFMYGIVLLSVTKLRFSQPNKKRGFKAPFGKIIPVILTIIIFLLAFNIDLDIILAGVLFMIMGLPIYLLKSLRESNKTPKLFYSIITRLPGYDLLSRSSYDYKISKKMIEDLDVSGNVLEVDCKTSLFFRDIHKEINSNLKIGTDLSFAPLIRANKKNREAFFINADTGELPFKDNSFDFIFCMGLSPQIFDLESFIREIIRVLKPEGKARILEFSDVLGFESFYSPSRFSNIVKKYGYTAKIKRERYGGVNYDFITISVF